MLEVIKSAPQDENQKELTTIVANLKCLLDWFRQEEKSFIDLKEIGEIANRNTNTIGAPLAQDFPVFNTEEEAISSMAFIDLINNLRLGISYFDMIIKRYESLIEAYQVFQLKKDEYQKSEIKEIKSQIQKKKGDKNCFSTSTIRNITWLRKKT